MTQYETAFLISPNLEEEETEKVIVQMAEVVSKKKGKMINEDRWGKRRLAYPIKKFEEAFYVFFHYEGDSEIPSELERRFKQSEAILRYLTVKKELKENIRRKKKGVPAEKKRTTSVREEISEIKGVEIESLEREDREEKVVAQIRDAAAEIIPVEEKEIEEAKKTGEDKEETGVKEAAEKEEPLEKEIVAEKEEAEIMEVVEEKKPVEEEMVAEKEEGVEGKKEPEVVEPAEEEKPVEKEDVEEKEEAEIMKGAEEKKPAEKEMVVEKEEDVKDKKEAGRKEAAVKKKSVAKEKKEKKKGKKKDKVKKGAAPPAEGKEDE